MAEGDRMILDDASRILSECAPYISKASRTKFQTDVLKINSAYLGDDQFRNSVVAVSAQISYNQMMCIIDTSTNNWQIGMNMISSYSRAKSNAYRLNQLYELTLQSLDSRPITIVFTCSSLQPRNSPLASEFYR